MSFVYLVVYIGAIAILFLFMIMMLNINSINSFHFIPSLIPFFLYLSIFFKGIYLIFLVNKNIFIFYIDYLQTTIFALNYSNAAYSELFNSSYVFYLQNIRIYDTYGASFYFTKVTTDSLADILISGLEPASSELANFCILYDIYSLYFILAGFILLYAMLGSISLCIAK
jgi:NADH:ubiquinone oxidoreductase subunit 6 (subunit J)